MEEDSNQCVHSRKEVKQLAAIVDNNGRSKKLQNHVAIDGQASLEKNLHHFATLWFLSDPPEFMQPPLEVRATCQASENLGNPQ